MAYRQAFLKQLGQLRWWEVALLFVSDIIGVPVLSVLAATSRLSVNYQYVLWLVVSAITVFYLYRVGKAAWDEENAKRMELEEQMKPTLDLVFDPSLPQCLEDTPLVDADNPDNVARTFRVGLVNRGKRAVEGVRVDLTVLEPHRTPFLPLRLRRMHEQYAGHADPYATFDLNPSLEPTEFISIAHKRRAGNGSDHISLFYAGLSPNTIILGEYHLQIVAHGRGNVPLPYRRWFKMWVDERGLLQLKEETRD